MKSSSHSQLGFLFFVPYSVGMRTKELLSEGLYRYCFSLALAYQSRVEEPVVFLVPRWAKTYTVDAISRLKADKVSTQMPRVVSPPYSVLDFFVSALGLEHRKVASKKQSQLLKRTIAFLLSWLGFATILALSPLLAILGTLIGLLGAGILIVGLLLYLLVRGDFTDSRLHRALGNLFGVSASGLFGDLRTQVRDAVYVWEMKTFTAAANRHRLSTWFIPVPQFPLSSNLRAKSIILFPDFVALEKPSMFLEGPAAWNRVSAAMKTQIESSQAVVCLSEHVRDYHLRLVTPSVEMSKVVVSPPGPPLVVAPKSLVDSDSRELLCQFIRYSLPSSRAGEEGWWEDPVVVLPTRPRPYKGILPLLLGLQRAYEVFGSRWRMVVTFDQALLPDSVRKSDYSGAIEFLPDLSDEQMQLVYRLSTLSASASFFEASLPFVMAESLAARTPTILARNPVTNEILSGAGISQASWLFDPASPDSVAEALEFGRLNRSQLVESQTEFMRAHYSKFSWNATVDTLFDIVKVEDVSKRESCHLPSPGRG